MIRRIRLHYWLPELILILVLILGALPLDYFFLGVRDRVALNALELHQHPLFIMGVLSVFVVEVVSLFFALRYFFKIFLACSFASIFYFLSLVVLEKNYGLAFFTMAYFTFCFLTSIHVYTTLRKVYYLKPLPFYQGLPEVAIPDFWFESNSIKGQIIQIDESGFQVMIYGKKVPTFKFQKARLTYLGQTYEFPVKLISSLQYGSPSNQGVFPLGLGFKLQVKEKEWGSDVYQNYLKLLDRCLRYGA